MVAKVLEQLTDEDHPLTANEIADILTKCGMTCEYRSILRDIKQLEEFYEQEIEDDDYADILDYKNEIKLKQDYYNRGYRMTQRAFDYEDIQILLECVDNAKFISNKKAKNLKNKLASLRSVYEKKKLLEINTSTTGRFKTTEKNITYSMSTINEAIKHNHKISFTYDYYEINNGKINKTKIYNRPIIVSPFKLVMNDSFYYLICCKDKEELKKETFIELQEEYKEDGDYIIGESLDEEYKELYEEADEARSKHIFNYRIDKMDDVIELKENRYGDDIFKKIDINNYIKECFDMYSFAGGREFVTIQFNNYAINEVVDRFGTDCISFKKDDKNNFYVNAYVYISPFFFSWVMSFEGKARIIKPKYVKELYDSKINIITNNAYFDFKKID